MANEERESEANDASPFLVAAAAVLRSLHAPRSAPDASEAAG